MNVYPEQERRRLVGQTPFKSGLGYIIKNKLRKRSNKNIYTKILFSNMIIFLIGLITLMFISNFLVKQVAYYQFRQELLYKAERINLALFQLTLREKDPMFFSQQVRINLQGARRAWKEAQNLFEEGIISKKDSDNARANYHAATEAYYKAAELQVNAQVKSRKELLQFLVDLFNAKRITIFNKDGIVTDTSAEYENGSDSKVDQKFIKLLNKNKIIITQEVIKETNKTSVIAVIPNENKQNNIESGILLEMEPPDFEGVNHKTQLYLIVGGLGLLILIIFHSVYLAMNISRPISHLANAAIDINRGGEVLNIKDQSLEEVNVLASQISKLKQQLQRVQAESSKMDEERSRLFAEISHELRTPLTSVQGFVEAIRDGMVQDKVLLDRYLDTIYTQTVHIGRLVDDILVLSRLESDSMIIEKQPLDLITTIQRVVTSFEAEAKNRNTILLLEKKTNQAFVIGDVDRMEQIVRNLLKNAFKATENGTIKIYIGVTQNEVVLKIEDNGIGIAAEDLPHIWERFYRAKNQRGSNVKEKGSGLGLVIVKSLVHLQGGTINVESQLGKGTTFMIRFPAFR